LKKITLVFENLFCDFCSYDVEEVLRNMPEVQNFKIYRKSNSVNVYLNNQNQFDKDKIKQLFKKENLKIIEILGG